MNRCPECGNEIETVTNADETTITNGSGETAPAATMAGAVMVEMMRHPEAFRFRAVPCGHEVSVVNVDGELRIKEDI